MLESLNDAFAAGILLRDAASFECPRFSHAQVREVLYDGIPATRRSRLHRGTGEVLEVSGWRAIPTAASTRYDHVEPQRAGSSRISLSVSARCAARAIVNRYAPRTTTQ